MGRCYWPLLKHNPLLSMFPICFCQAQWDFESMASKYLTDTGVNGLSPIFESLFWKAVDSHPESWQKQPSSEWNRKMFKEPNCYALLSTGFFSHIQERWLHLCSSVRMPKMDEHKNSPAGSDTRRRPPNKNRKIVVFPLGAHKQFI